MRPTYETAEDRVRADEVIAAYAEYRKASAKETPKSYAFDYVLYKDGKAIVVAEVKCRSEEMEKYRTLILSYRKVVALSVYGHFTEQEPVLVADWCDATAWITIPSHIDWKVTQGGRTDRDDPQDLEPCFHIPIGGFTLLRSKE